MQYAERFVASNKARVTILKMSTDKIAFLDPSSDQYAVNENFREVIEQRIPDKGLLLHFNLILVSLEYWDFISNANWVKESPSILVVKHNHRLKCDAEFADYHTLSHS
jgi:hypothetical protein